MKSAGNLGMLLLGLWFVVHGLEPLIHLSFRGLGTVTSVMAVAAGALIILGKAGV